MDLKYIIVLLLAFSTAATIILNKEKYGLYILTFCIPFAALPFKENGVLIGMNGIIIVVYWITLKFKYNIVLKVGLNNWLGISKKLLWLYYLLIMGFILGISHESYEVFNSPLLESFNPQEEILNFSAFIIIVILYLKIMVNYAGDSELQDKLLYIFTLTPFLHFIAYIFSIVGLANLLPAFMSTVGGNYSYGTIYRFWGLLGDYELIVDYAMVSIASSLILIIKGKHKVISLASIIVSIFCGLLSGTRSFLIIVPLFILVYIIGVLKDTNTVKNILKATASFSILLVILIFIQQNYLPTFTIFERLENTRYLVSSGNWAEASNRPFWDAIPDIINESMLLGNGSLAINLINKNEMVSHNIILSSYARYGIIGIILTLYIFMISFKKLLAIFRRISGKNRKVVLVWIALLVSLFAQEMKISAIRSLAPILIYAFMFINIYYIIDHHQNSENTQESE
ncbi:MAG: O-antigen ligase family protein [Ignavibacteriales bacterium]